MVCNKFQAVCLELKRNSGAWLLIAFASVIVFYVVIGLIQPVSKVSVFPKDNERYDIETVYVGQMKDFCPEEFQANPGRSEFESCVRKLDISRMVKVKVPTFKDTIDRSPNLPHIMKNSSDPNIVQASHYFKEGNYFVVGVKIPERFFSIDGNYLKDGKINVDTTNYNLLVFKGVRFGTACINGSCNYLLKIMNDNFTSIPLVRKIKNSNVVWLFGLENTSPHGLWLEDGILITQSENMMNLRSFYDMTVYGKSMLAGIAFVALFLVSLPFAIYLRKFPDYPAFSYFAGSTALFFADVNLCTIFFEWLPGIKYRLLNIWIILNFVLSVLILSAAYARFKVVLKKRYIFIAHGVLLGLILIFRLCFNDLGSIVAVWGKIILTCACVLTVFALFPLGYRIYSLSVAIRHKNKTEIFVSRDHERRIKELIIYFVALVVFCSSYAQFAIVTLNTGNVSSETFFGTSFWVALFLLGIMLYYTQSKEITHMADAMSKQAQFMAHDIRRPFSQIKLVLSMFDSFGANPQKLEEAKQEVDTSIKRVEAMLSDLIESNKSASMLKLKNISAKELTELSFDQISLDESAVPVRIVNKVDKTHVVLGDEQKLVRCFVNILENAVDAVNAKHDTGFKGVIELSSKKVNVNDVDYIELTIANNGPSIDENDMSKLFESFFTKGKTKGTGLGLAFTHRIVSLHGGSIKARNRTNDNGVDFIITLPVNKCACEQRPFKPSSGHVTLLILDDESFYRSMAKEIALQNKNIVVVEAGSVEDAIKLTKEHSITHALVDYDLNTNENGTAYFEYVRKKKLNINCALHSNRYLDDEMKAKLARYNALYIIKPLDTDKLYSFIYKGGRNG